MYPHPAWKVPLSLFSMAEGEFMCKCVTSTTEPPVGPTFLHSRYAHTFLYSSSRFFVTVKYVLLPTNLRLKEMKSEGGLNFGVH